MPSSDSEDNGEDCSDNFESEKETEMIPSVGDGVSPNPMNDDGEPVNSSVLSLSVSIEQIMKLQAMEEIEYGTKLFKYIVEEQHQIRNHLLLLAESTT